MITIAKMVQAAKAAQIQAHLVQLVPALLESLSSMEVRATLLSSIHRELTRTAPLLWMVLHPATVLPEACMRKLRLPGV